MFKEDNISTMSTPTISQDISGLQQTPVSPI